MKTNFVEFKSQYIKHKKEILKMFNECEKHRAMVEIVNVHLDSIKNEILANGEYHTSKKYIDVVGFDVIKNYDYVYFITEENGESEKFNQILFDKIMSDKLLNDYFDLSEMKPSFICGLKAHVDYKKDFQMMNLLRKFKGHQEKTLSYNSEWHIKEYESIKSMIKVLKYL